MLIKILSMTLSISCTLLMYSPYTPLTCLQTAAHSSIVTAAKFRSASGWTSRSLKVTFFAAILVFTTPRIFFIWGLNHGGREAVRSLRVHSRLANRGQLQKSHIAVYAFLWDRTTLLLSCRSCTVYHVFSNQNSISPFFWHSWLGVSWAVHCCKMHCRPQ